MRIKHRKDNLRAGRRGYRINPVIARMMDQIEPWVRFDANGEMLVRRNASTADLIAAMEAGEAATLEQEKWFMAYVMLRAQLDPNWVPE